MPDFVKFHFDNVFYEEPMFFAPFNIIQVGDIDTYSGFKCRKHTQVANEITYIVSGNANILCGDKEYFCKSGDVIFNPKDTLHAIDSADGKSLRYYYIAFEIADISNHCEQSLNEFFQKNGAGMGEADRGIPQTFHDIFFNLYGKDEFSEIIVADSVRKLLIYTMRSLDGSANSVYFPDLRFGKKHTVSQICSFIDSYAENIAVLKKLPEKFGYSYSYISSFFSKSMGISLQEFFLMSRHKRACELLCEGYSVTAVAEKMGYSSIHVFSKAFSARESMSPSAYAEKFRKSEPNSSDHITK